MSQFAIHNSQAKTERSLFSTFQHNMYITYLDGTVVLYIQQEEHFHFTTAMCSMFFVGVNEKPEEYAILK